MSERTDRELVEKAQRGDGGAIGELFSRYWRAARAAAFGVTGEFASAEDAAADAFRQASAGINSLRDPDRFGSWLRTIVVRRARLALQSRAVPIAPLADDYDQNQRPDEALLRLELGAMVQQATRELPNSLREAVALVYFEGYDAESAARFLNIPGSTLRRRLHDGRIRLRSAVEQVFRGRKQMNEERERQVRKLETMIEAGEIYEALRGVLALRPPPSEVIGMALERQSALGNLQDAAGSGELLREKVRRLSRPSGRASDPSHAVGAIGAAIRKALPEFQDWQFDASEAAIRFIANPGEYRSGVQATLPPGFAEGRPGAFLRATRAIVRLSACGGIESVYEHLRASPDEDAFRRGTNEMRLSDVLDLMWMAAGPLELRSVQELLDRLVLAVLPGTHVQFSPYDEPRYRAALQFHFEGVAARGGYGGVLNAWPGSPRGADAAHVRILLEPWATVRTGNSIEFGWPEWRTTTTAPD